MSTKTYLIIGGTGGIGRAMVEQLVESTANNGDKDNLRVFATCHKSVPDFAADNL